MSIRIEREKCVGCGRCSDICPGNLIFLDQERKAGILHPFDCWGCTACMKTCPVGAICLILDPELDGRGEVLTVHREGSGYLWEITDSAGRVRSLRTDSKRANEY